MGRDDKPRPTESEVREADQKLEKHLRDNLGRKPREAENEVRRVREYQIAQERESKR